MVPVALSVVVAVALTGCSGGGGDGKDASEQTAKDFLAKWQAGDIAGAAALTDDQAKASAQLDAARQQLQLKSGEYVPGAYTKGSGDKPGTLAYKSKIMVGGIAQPVEFDAVVPVVKKDDKPVVHWQSTIVHPQYAEGSKFVNSRKLPDRASILDRQGNQLAGSSPVVAISLWPAKMGANADAIYAELSKPLYDVDVPKLKERVAKTANQDQAVEVVSLKKDVFESQARAKLAPFAPGVQIKETTQQTALAAKQLVGTTGAATAEILAKKGYENAGAGDTVGTSGLQARYQGTLGGTATSKLTIEGPNKQPVATLVDIQGKPGTPVKTTIDKRLQELAEQSVKISSDKNAALVAIDTKTGEILAAANNPPTGQNRAFEGHYAPGSTFKTVTAAALLQAGLKPSDPAPCVATVVVNGQTFKNYDALDPIPNADFGTDFAMSCNTGFIDQRSKLQNDSLAKVAKDVFGIGDAWDVGASTFDGSVPAATSANELSASMIGQGKVQASPLVMASVAATVDSGTFNQPVLVTEPALPGRVAAKPVDPALAQELKGLMQRVVQSGTAQGPLSGSGAEGAKTGTAEFSEGGATLTNGWMIAFKGDIAVAVIVEKGKSGGVAAGPLVKAFLSGV
ncbi:penicillin-binding transpeptidase domain-containing protein [Yinghuangia soli]|uniref:Penicillin-binding protein n=1 Tax=Yinghuangia soli TaxID=2908204 RepID=A0AA41PYI1_9ACTN|nr:penicillin-binding transpeptidase domain-containing protein [Yinghuangia soli]MCF2527511.1 hypothetical protein [Yinghuangia soli]